MIVAVETAEGVYTVEIDTEAVVDFVAGAAIDEEAAPRVDLPRVVATAAAGSTVVALLDRRPPLAVSHDAGRTWREAGGGLPRGRAIAISPDDPDVVVYGARNRLYLSRDGGTLWRALAPELPEIEVIALA